MAGPFKEGLPRDLSSVVIPTSPEGFKRFVRQYDALERAIDEEANGQRFDPSLPLQSSASCSSRDNK
ncbi:MAG: hypothetical protein AAB801_01730 [Patescibacteria group bacterium]